MFVSKMTIQKTDDFVSGFKSLIPSHFHIQHTKKMMLSSLRRRPSAVLVQVLLLPDVASAIWRWKDRGGVSVTPRKIKPNVTRPSGPANVHSSSSLVVSSE